MDKCKGAPGPRGKKGGHSLSSELRRIALSLITRLFSLSHPAFFLYVLSHLLGSPFHHTKTWFLFYLLIVSSHCLFLHSPHPPPPFFFFFQQVSSSLGRPRQVFGLVVLQFKQSSELCQPPRLDFQISALVSWGVYTIGKHQNWCYQGHWTKVLKYEITG